MIRDTESLRMLASTLAARHCRPANDDRSREQHSAAGDFGTPSAQRNARRPQGESGPGMGGTAESTIEVLSHVPRRPPPPTDLGQATRRSAATFFNAEEPPPPSLKLGGDRSSETQSHQSSRHESIPRPTRLPPPIPNANADDVSHIWATARRLNDPGIDAPLSTNAPDPDVKESLSPLTPIARPLTEDSDPPRAAPEAHRSMFASLEDINASVIQKLTGLRREMSAGKLLPKRDAAVAVDAVKGHETEYAHHDVQSRVEELVRRLTAHQNSHVKMRSQLTLEVDKARWESDQADFRLAELQTGFEMAGRALRDRIQSRIATVAQLRRDAAQVLEQTAAIELPKLWNERQKMDQAGLLKRREAIETLKVTAEQLENHANLHIVSMEHRLSSAASENIVPLLTAAKQSTLAAARRDKQNTEAMLVMLTEFKNQFISQVAELRREREAFEERITARIKEISTR